MCGALALRVRNRGLSLSGALRFIVLNNNIEKTESKKNFVFMGYLSKILDSLIKETLGL
jgi:hypothetical protein